MNVFSPYSESVYHIYSTSMIHIQLTVSLVPSCIHLLTWDIISKLKGNIFKKKIWQKMLIMTTKNYDTKRKSWQKIWIMTKNADKKMIKN